MSVNAKIKKKQLQLQIRVEFQCTEHINSFKETEMYVPG